MAPKQTIKKFCECGKQQAELLDDGRIRMYTRCLCKTKVPGPCEPPGRLVSQHSWIFVDNGTESEIDKLANFIMKEVDGEPSKSEGAGTTAVRIIKQLQAKNKELREVIKNKDKALTYSVRFLNPDDCDREYVQQALKEKK